jgi:serine/threonine protein phosphatase 1
MIGKMKKSGKIICVGDIHGELGKLKRLFSKFVINEDDEIVFLGDYIDRGSNPRGVIDFVINLQKKYNVVCLLANHERFATESIANPNSPIVNSWVQNGGTSTMANYNWNLDELDHVHGDWLRSLKLIHETEDHIFVHGYLRHDKDVDEQDEDSCLWGRFDAIRPHKSGKTVVVGHTVQYGGHTDLGYKVCIDTGSFKPEGYITAMIIDGNKTRFVDSR